MKKATSVGILFSNFGPYHAARIEALAQKLEEAGLTLTAFRFSEVSDTYGWAPSAPEGVQAVTLGQKAPSGISESWALARHFYRQLGARQVRCVFLPTYSPLPNLLCFLAAKLRGCRTVLMTESWHGTEVASLSGKLIKHVLVRMFDSALVGGSPQTDYVSSYGMPREKVFMGYDVVDVAHFGARADIFRAMRKSDEWRVASDESRQSEVGDRGSEVGSHRSKNRGPEALLRSLPERYFLNLGRFVEKKNLSTLVEAYARFARASGERTRAETGTEGRMAEDRSPRRPNLNRSEAEIAEGKPEGSETADGGPGGVASPPQAEETGDRRQSELGGTENCELNTEHCAPALVLVGEGPLRGDLERQARELGLVVRDGVADPKPSGGAEVVFYPFQQADVTPLFFALCEAFVLPSTREEWGLVVNEAMACGAPVIVSRNVGCAQDLVGDVDREHGRRGDRSVTHPTGHTDNAPGTFDSINNTAGPEVQPYPEVTTGGEDTAAVDTRHSPLVTPHSLEPSSTVGFTFDPQNVDELAALLGRFAADPALRACLGFAGRRRIQDWTPERFGREGLKALHAASG